MIAEGIESAEIYLDYL